MAFSSVSHPCLPLRSPWDPVSISRTDHLSLSLCIQGSWRAARGKVTGLWPRNGTQPYFMETGHTEGTGDGTISCRPELVMASCLIQKRMVSVAKPSQGRVKSDPGPAWGGASCHCWPLTAGFHRYPLWQSPRSWLLLLQTQKSIWTLLKDVRSWKSHHFFCLFILVVNLLSLIRSL